MFKNSTLIAAPRFGLEWAQELEEGIVGAIHDGRIDCVEIIPENFFDGRFESFLDVLQKTGVPVAVHGVLLSLGTMEPLREAHLERVMEIAGRVNMVNFSEHLSLTTVDEVDLDALTPLNWTEEVLSAVTEKIRAIQKRVSVPFLFENVSNRFVIPDGDYSETAFMNELMSRTGCGLLLDVTNVHTNSVNFGFDPFAWIDELRLDAVELVHLAGGHYDPEGFLLDSHDNSVCDEAWELYGHLCRKRVPPLTILERTGSFPAFENLSSELARARRESSVELSGVVPRPDAKNIIHAGGVR